jgi:hypothetical protein
VLDSTLVEQLLEDLEAYLEEYLTTHGKEYEEILRRTKLNYDHMIALRHSCSTHIDYIIPENDVQKSSEYAAFIARECRLPGIILDMEEGVEEWRAQLRVSIATESRIALLHNGKVKAFLRFL